MNQILVNCSIVGGAFHGAKSVVNGVLISLVLFTVTSLAQVVGVVHTFNGNTASQYPEGTPTQGRDGNLYGTSIGLTSGSIFRLATNGLFHQLLALDGTNGASPFTGLTLANDGNFYGTAAFGGSAGCGVVS